MWNMEISVLILLTLQIEFKFKSIEQLTALKLWWGEQSAGRLCARDLSGYLAGVLIDFFC